MMAEQTISVYRKNDMLLQISVTDETGAALDLTGAALTFAVRSISGASTIFMKTLANGITVANVLAGTIEIDLTAAETDIQPGTYRLELLVTDVNGNRYTALVGMFSVLASLTA